MLKKEFIRRYKPELTLERHILNVRKTMAHSENTESAMNMIWLRELQIRRMIEAEKNAIENGETVDHDTVKIINSTNGSIDSWKKCPDGITWFRTTDSDGFTAFIHYDETGHIIRYSDTNGWTYRDDERTPVKFDDTDCTSYQDSDGNEV